MEQSHPQAVPTKPWKCSKCSTVVFIPDTGTVTGGVCTQQRRGCSGEIEQMSSSEATETRLLMTARGIQEQPWLTLVFSAPRGA